MAEVRFDDLDRLNALAGEFGRWGPEREISQHLIDRFAALTGDDRWIHVDVELSTRKSPFGGPVAQGFLMLSLLPRLSLDHADLTIVGHGSAVNYGAEKLRFISPVPAGARVHARSRLMRAEARPKGTLVTTEHELAVVRAARPSLLYAMQGLYLGG